MSSLSRSSNHATTNGLRIPFALRRPWLVLRDLMLDRERPDLAGLASVADPEAFVWKILPHAARTFSASIALLPSAIAKAAAGAYLYCRVLDTYEDLLPEHEQRQRALAAFVDRLQSPLTDGLPLHAPRIAPTLARDNRDRAHVILVNRCHLVDAVFLTLPPAVRAIILDLVRDMAAGMAWSSGVFAKQNGTLGDGEQLARYCRHVLGAPVIFAAKLILLHQQGHADLASSPQRDAIAVGEMVQLANITRDIEKDLRRGIAYDPALAADLGKDSDGDPALAERIRGVRERLLIRALAHAPAYGRLIEALGFPRISLARASAVLMLLFTDRYYRGCARRVGRTPWGRYPSSAALLLRALPAAWSRAWARRLIHDFQDRAASFNHALALGNA